MNLRRREESSLGEIKDTGGLNNLWLYVTGKNLVQDVNDVIAILKSNIEVLSCFLGFCQISRSKFIEVKTCFLKQFT